MYKHHVLIISCASHAFIHVLLCYLRILGSLILNGFMAARSVSLGVPSVPEDLALSARRTRKCTRWAGPAAARTQRPGGRWQLGNGSNIKGGFQGGYSMLPSGNLT